MDRRRYPKNWDAIALQVKEQAGWICDHCGRPCLRPGQTIDDLTQELMDLDPHENGWIADLWEDVYDHETGEWGYVPRPQRFRLTVAHLNHRPEDCSPKNLRALCAPCHLRYDAPAVLTKRRLKAEYQGQLTLDLMQD